MTYNYIYTYNEIFICVHWYISKYLPMFVSKFSKLYNINELVHWLYDDFLRNGDVLQHIILHPFAKKRQLQIVRVVSLLTFKRTDCQLRGVKKSKLIIGTHNSTWFCVWLLWLSFGHTIATQCFSLDSNYHYCGSWMHPDIQQLEIYK